MYAMSYECINMVSIHYMHLWYKIWRKEEDKRMQKLCKITPPCELCSNRSNCCPFCLTIRTVLPAVRMVCKVKPYIFAYRSIG